MEGRRGNELHERDGDAGVRQRSCMAVDGWMSGDTGSGKQRDDLVQDRYLSTAAKSSWSYRPKSSVSRVCRMCVLRVLVHLSGSVNQELRLRSIGRIARSAKLFDPTCAQISAAFVPDQFRRPTVPVGHKGDLSVKSPKKIFAGALREYLILPAIYLRE